MTLPILFRLIEDRELNLFDGTLFVSPEKYKHLQIKFGDKWEQEFKQRKIEMIHPSFRILATASPPKRDNPWLTHQAMHLFHFFDLSSFSSFHLMKDKQKEEDSLFVHICSVLVKTCPNLDKTTTEKLSKFYILMQKLSEEDSCSISNPISLRALIRVASFCEKYGTEYLHSTISRSLMLGYITPITRDLIVSQLVKVGILPSEKEYFVEMKNIIVDEKNETIRIGDTVSPLYKPKEPALVPDIIFYNIPKHTQILELMLKDFLLGEHLLLIGSQVKKISISF